MIAEKEWEVMSPTNRIAAARSLSEYDVATLYSRVPSSPERGPRLTRNEWESLGSTARGALHPFFPVWEASIVDAWSDQNYDDPAQIAAGAWSKKAMHALMVWSIALPVVGLIIFLCNVWRPGRLAQSVHILAGAVMMACIVWPLLLGFFYGLAGGN